jgi:hypothetical protein
MPMACNSGARAEGLLADAGFDIDTLPRNFDAAGNSACPIRKRAHEGDKLILCQFRRQLKP